MNDKFRLIAQTLILNTTGLAFLFIAWINGWVAEIIKTDSSYISLVILSLFIFALTSVIHQALCLSKELDDPLKPNNAPKSPRPFEIHMFSRISHLRAISDALVVLGLIGTVVGFIIIANGIDADSAGDINKVGQLVATLLNGMGVAFYTTLTGAVFGLWIKLNYQILHAHTAKLVALVTEQAHNGLQLRNI